MSGRLHRALHAVLPHHDPVAADTAAWRSTRLGEVDPRLKLVFLAAALGVNLLSHRWTTCALLFGLALAGFACQGRRLLAANTLRLLPGLVVAAPVGLIRALLDPPPYVAQLRLGPVGLHLSQAGLGAGALLAGRILGGLALIALLTASTPIPRMLAALTWFRVPGPVLEVAGLMYRYLFVLLDEAERLTCAQRLRARRASRRLRLREASVVGGGLLIRAYDRAQVVAEAQALRSGSGPAARAPLGRPGWGEISAAGLVLAAVAISAWW
ncbi:MAG: cobalt ECF transporter T component CbiQ [Thermoleophilia bacterium]